MDKETLNIFEMTNKEAQIIIGNIPVYPDDCYSVAEYQWAKSMAIKALDEQSMRDATEEERKSVKDYIESISKPTGVQIEAQPTDKCKGCYYNDGEAHAECVVCDKGAQPCEDCISRQAVIDLTWDWESFTNITRHDGLSTLREMRTKIEDLPPVTPQFTEEEIDKMQEIEQAYVDKMVELAVEEVRRPRGKWIDCKCSRCNYEVMKWNKTNFCPNCGSYNKEEEDGTNH